MSARFRKLALAALSVAMLMLPAGLQAQDPAAPPAQDPAAPPAQDNVTIGPPQLRGFQLPGTTTTQAPQEVPPATPPATPGPATTGSPPAGTAPPAETPAPAPDPNVPPAAEADDGARDLERAAPERTRAPVRAETPGEPAAPPSGAPLAAPDALDTTPVAPSEPGIKAEQAAEPGSALGWLYLLLAVAIAAAAGLFVARKLRTAGVEEAEEAYYAEPAPAEPQAEIVPSPAPAAVAEPAPEPAPAAASKPSGPVVSTLRRPAPAKPAPVRQPAPAQPAPAPAAPAAATGSGGVVGLAIRPWLNLEFIPDRAAATQTEAVVQYELLLKNVGNMVAGNIRVAVRMLNAGADQDEQINAFFSQPIGAGPSVSKVLAIPPRKGARLRSAVSMSNEEVREISVQGRRLFIPLVAINVLYEWGNGRVGQTAASYLVGREPDAPEGKMGPFRLDLGPRVYRSVGQRPNKVALVV